MGGLAVLALLAATAPAVNVLAQDRGQDHRDGGQQQYDGRDRGRGDDRGRNDGGAFIGGVALGAVLGTYAGHPYYCRDHHHWRWSNRQHRYVSVTTWGHDC